MKKKRGDVGDTQEEGHAIEGVERQSGEARKEGNELRRCKNRFRRK
jgi:hypothetical protein